MACGICGGSPSGDGGTRSGGLDDLAPKPVPRQQLRQMRARPPFGHTIDDVDKIVGCPLLRWPFAQRDARRALPGSVRGARRHRRVDLEIRISDHIG